MMEKAYPVSTRVKSTSWLSQKMTSSGGLEVTICPCRANTDGGHSGGPTGGNEATLFQLLHRHRLALGQGMVLPADKHHRTAKKLPIDTILWGGLLEGEQHLNISFGEQIVQGAEGNQTDHGQNPLLLLAQPLQSRAQQPQVCRAAAPQPQRMGRAS